MSFHGMPQSYVDNGDVYYEQCLNTSKLLAKALNLDPNDYLLSFQSIFGKEDNDIEKFNELDLDERSIVFYSESSVIL